MNLEKKSRKSIGIFIAVAVALLVVIFMDTWIVFRMTAQQSKNSGMYQLSSIRGEFEGTLSRAENYATKLAMSAQSYLGDKERLRRFIYEKGRELAEGEDGGFNVYIAGKGWSILPGMENRDDFDPTGRVWYTGAVRNGGEPYVTSPYVDVVYGEVCYTVSILLPDRETVLAVDYTIDSIQSHISQMYEQGSGDAVIVTEDGIIAGCSNETLIGSDLVSAMPDYAGIYALARGRDGVVTGRLKSGLTHENLFATRSGNGWYLIVSENDWSLYKDSYLQFILTTILSVALFVIILILFIFSNKNRDRAEAALSTKEDFLKGITGELYDPLRRILELSDKRVAELSVDRSNELARINLAGRQLSEMIGQLMSYSGIVKAGKRKSERAGAKSVKSGSDNRFRVIILSFMITVMVFCLYSNIRSTLSWGKLELTAEVEGYERQLSQWVNTQKTILDMFVSILSTNPGILEDYEGAKKFLNDIAVQYPEISVCYMANPAVEHTVIMNNGWEPDEDWRVEERTWYIDTMNSKTGWNISAPYLDVQTGLYCVTLSERVYYEKTGGFIGVFGIDFYMDKLVEILGTSYSETGYAFLVDLDGNVINHPFGLYQMTEDGTTNISQLPLAGLYPDKNSTIVFRDYDNALRVAIASRLLDSYFTVYAVSGFGKIYGRVIIYALVILVISLLCILMVNHILKDMIRSREEAGLGVRSATEAAQAAEDAKNLYLNRISGEITSRLTPILGMNELIFDGAKDPELRRYSLGIKTAGESLLSLVHSILDYSKIVGGMLEIFPVEYEFPLLISNSTSWPAKTAAGKGLVFEIEADRDIPLGLYGDMPRISQVLTNLLMNAVNYTREGEVRLSVSLEGMRDDEALIHFEVKDSGPGIRQEDMDTVRAPFGRLEEEVDVRGTGLGLAIVTGLLELMGSQLSVVSAVGEGSVFSFTLCQKVLNASPVGEYRKWQRNHLREAGEAYLDENKISEEQVKSDVAPEEEIIDFAPEEEIIDFAPEDEMIEFIPEDDPDEILEFFPEKKKKPSKSVDPIAALKEAGFNTEGGISYCGGDRKFYLEMLGDFAAAYEDRAGKLKDYCDKKDMKEYHVLVHALKSVSRTIGADELSERAHALEDAAKAGDLAFVEKDNPGFLEQYAGVAERIRVALS